MKQARINRLVSSLRVQPRYPVQYFATINNPLTLAYENEPVGLRVQFPPQLVPTGDYIRVKSPDGNYVPFQWDPSINPLTDASRGSYIDGSLHEGTIWVIVPFFAPRAELNYVIEIFSAPQNQVFPQAVTYASVGGTDERFDTARMQLDFNSGKQWMPARYRDKLAASENLFNGTQGCFTQYQTTGGTTRSSFTAGDVASNVKARIGTANFGYGVVFQDFQVDFTWNPETTVVVREQFRIWANGAFSRSTRHSVTGAITSTAKRMTANLQPENTGMTGTYDADRVYKEFVWANKRMIGLLRTMSFDYPVKTTETHSTNVDGTTNNNQVLWGWQGTTTLAAGAFFFAETVYDLAYAAGDGLNQWTRRMNPIYAWATPFQIDELKDQFESYAYDLMADFLPYATNDGTNSYAGAAGLVQLAMAESNNSNVREAARLKYLAWCAAVGITPTSAASYLAAWSGGLGWEFLGKNVELLLPLYYEYLHGNDRTNAAVIAQYIHAVADATVSMEVTSGGGGQMKLDGPGVDNYNAEASALGALAASLKLENNGTRYACYVRIVNRYMGGVFAQTKSPYSIATPGQPSDVVKAARSTYFSYSQYQLWLAHSIVPFEIAPLSTRQYLFEYTTPSGIADEWRFQLQQTRRGLPNTLIYGMFALAMERGHRSDWAWIVREMEYLVGKRNPGTWIQHQLEGLTGTDVSALNAAVDVRALAQLILKM